MEDCDRGPFPHCLDLLSNKPVSARSAQYNVDTALLILSSGNWHMSGFDNSDLDTHGEVGFCT